MQTLPYHNMCQTYFDRLGLLKWLNEYEKMAGSAILTATPCHFVIQIRYYVAFSHQTSDKSFIFDIFSLTYSIDRSTYC